MPVTVSVPVAVPVKVTVSVAVPVSVSVPVTGTVTVAVAVTVTVPVTAIRGGVPGRRQWPRLPESAARRGPRGVGGHGVASGAGAVKGFGKPPLRAVAFATL